MKNNVFVAMEHKSNLYAPDETTIHGVYHCYSSATEKLISIMADDSEVHDNYLEYVTRLDMDETPMSYREYIEEELSNCDDYEIIATILDE